MKKCIIVFLLIFSLTFFCGCSNKEEIKISSNYIMLSIDQNIDGSTKQSIVFSVNSDFLRKNSKNVAEEFKFKQNLIKNVEELRNEFLFSFALIYMQNPIDEYKINQGVLLSQVGYNAEEDYVGFELTFTSLGAWKYYHSSNKTSENQEESEKNGNIFYQKHQSEGKFPFSASIAEGSTVGEKYKNFYLSSSSGLSFEEAIRDTYQPKYVYNYSTYYSKFHSNADLKFKGSDKKYHHVWIEEDLKNCSAITLSSYTIYKGWWIFFTLAICLSAMIVSIVVVKLKKKKN